MVQMAHRCIAAGHRVRVYTLQWTGDRPADIDVVTVPVGALTNHRRYQRFARWVAHHLAENPTDVVVGMNKMPGLDVYYAGDSCYAEIARVRHGWLYRMLPRYRVFSEFEEAVFGSGSRTEIMTISGVQTPLFKRHYGTDDARLHPLPPGIDRSRVAPSDRDAIRDRFRAEFGIGEHELLLLFLGSGFIKKGLDRALRGMAALPDALLQNSRMFVVGQDNPRRFAGMARRLGLAGRVRFLQGRDDVPRFLFGSDVLVLPAHDENAGMAILEAIIAGLPAIVTANCGYAHYVAEAEAGRVVPQPYAQAQLDSMLEEMLEDCAARQRWSRNGMAFGQNADIFSLHERAAKFIIETARDKQRAGLHDDAPDESWQVLRRIEGFTGQLLLRDDLAGRFAQGNVFDTVMTIEGEVHRALANRCTLRIEHEGRGYFIKRHTGVGWRELLKNLAVGKRPVVDAANEFIACRRLTAAGISTLSIAGYGRIGFNPARRRSFVISDELSEHITLEDYVANWGQRPPAPAFRRRLIQAVAELARTMHGVGVVHRDFYICHLLLDRRALADGRVKLSVIDLHRARVASSAGSRWVQRDLGALLYSAMDLNLSLTDRFRFIACYSGESAAEVLRRRPRFWARVQRRADRLYRKRRRKATRDNRLATA
jgi:UDP-glucose:(heptosyl)LPS alpha-1,3-glucosyltransferase